MSDDESRRDDEGEEDTSYRRRRRNYDDSDEEETQEEEEQPQDDDEADEAAEAERRRQEAQARMREAQQRKKKGSKRKGLCLSPEKKKLLKQLIMEKAAEEMRAEAKKRAEEKERHITSNVPSLNVDNLDKSALLRKVQELHKLMAVKEDEKYEWEFKIRKQDLEINELNSKVADIKGKFVKPVLKKVTKTEKLSKLESKKGDAANFRSSLKSTGQSKYQLDDQPQEPKTPDWRGNLKEKGKEGEGEGGAEVNGEVDGPAEEEVEA